jgi:glycosyltransferase involved in cell wall biosynthesis
LDLISVVIPFYNSERFIAEAIRSVLQQTYINFEIVCVNNNSTDNSEKIVTELMREFPEKITLINEVNKGANYARNTGIKHAAGNIIQFLDADDIIQPQKFESQIKGFESPEVNIVVSDRVSMDESLARIVKKYSFEQIEKQPLNTVISQIIITGNPLYKKDFLNKICLWDCSLPNAQDWELNIRAVLNGATIKYIKGDLLISRSVSDSLSSNWKEVSFTSAGIIIKYHSQILTNKEKLNESSLKKIFYIFYLSAIYAPKAMQKEFCDFILKNIFDWRSYLNNPAKKMIAGVLGLKNTIKIERKLANFKIRKN